jgi:hypothetical protein
VHLHFLCSPDFVEDQEELPNLSFQAEGEEISEEFITELFWAHLNNFVL